MALTQMLLCLTHLSLSEKSYKTDAKEVSYEALYEAPLTRKTRLYLQYLSILMVILLSASSKVQKPGKAFSP